MACRWNKGLYSGIVKMINGKVNDISGTKPTPDLKAVISEKYLLIIGNSKLTKITPVIPVMERSLPTASVL